jgi:hypothetical protein
MSKRRIALLSLISFSLSLPVNPAYALVKAGAACKKVGITSVALGKTYTCTKSGKKLVWDKGVSKTTSTVPAPADTPISFDNLDPKSVRKKAYDNLSKVIQTRSRTTYKPTLIVGPNAKKSRIDQEMPGLNRSIDFWAPYFVPTNFQIVYVDRGDEAWIDQKSSELGLSIMLPEGQTWKEQFTRDNECEFGMAGSPKGVSTFVQCLGFPYGDGSRQGAPHEYTHLYQQGLAKSNAFEISWYTEGSATFFGWIIAMHGNDPQFTKQAQFFNAQFSQMSEDAKSDFKSRDISKFKSRMQILSGRNSRATSLSGSYWVGGLAFEVLVALYGVDKFVELTKNLELSKDISSLLQQTYGFNADYFYEKLAPYVWAQIPA